MTTKTLNKKALAESLSAKLDITKKDAAEFIEAFLEEVKSTLESKDTVDLAGFGKFVVKERAARDGFNPATNEKIRIEASYGISFKPAKALKESVK
ncbi:diphthine synthase [Erysipelothrix larvae]|uniref:Diphthine synthase n=1 Tax=Erysipelothrix larvae TaxID=1514105 RepID=A0A120JTM9_9FIRM|nr:HU family DNA-binding protein [Erysipelothrix larvae]AMC93345.1 diphthine synthase [Erysipelothrix larvae]